MPSGASGSGRPGQLLGHGAEVARNVLVQGLEPQVHLVGLQVERAGAVAHRFEALLGRVPVLAQALELLAPGAHRVDLVLVVVAQRLEDAVEPFVLALDDDLQPGQRGALGLQPAPARRRRRPLLGVALQPALHLGLALGQDAAALGDTGDAHLELLAPAPERDPPRLQCVPGFQSLRQFGQRSGQVRLLGRHLGQALVRRRQRAAGLLELPGHAALLLGGAVPVGPARLTGRGMAVVRPLRGGAGVAAAAEHYAALGQLAPGPARRRPPRHRPAGAPLRPRRP